MKFIGLLFLALPIVAAIDSTFGSSIEDCGDIRSHTFLVAPYLEVAADLQSLGQQKAVERLRKWAETKKHDEQVIILCRMLFEAKPGKEFRRPLIGRPQLFGGTTMEDWPLEPITLVDGRPFLIVITYVFAGEPANASLYLDYCLANTAWTSRKYQPATKEEIFSSLEKLEKQTEWKNPLSNWELGLLREQSKFPGAR